MLAKVKTLEINMKFDKADFFSKPNGKVQPPPAAGRNERLGHSL
jgi:hypothetical protein